MEESNNVNNPNESISHLQDLPAEAEPGETKEIKSEEPIAEPAEQSQPAPAPSEEIKDEEPEKESEEPEKETEEPEKESEEPEKGTEEPEKEPEEPEKESEEPEKESEEPEKESEEPIIKPSEPEVTDREQSDENEKESEENGEEAEYELPPITLPDPTSGYKNDISVFCISQQGQSHINNNVPCQDRSGFRWVNDQILLAAIADGVGSCQLSHYGAEIAVNSSLDYLEQFLKTESMHENFNFDTPARMKTALSGAMEHAYDSVNHRAEELEVLSYSMQSTLTVAAYDGTTLYFGHAGDDGIVALNKEGTYAMATSRIKGEEASSVYPLQSRRWYYGKVDNTVAFIMATDGVLDAFVRSEAENNRIYYPFIEPVFYTVQTDEESAASNCSDWDEFLKTENYRNTVTDDLTFVGVVNQKAIQHSVKPVFDAKVWNDQTAEYEKKRREALYPPQSPKKPEDKKKRKLPFASGRRSTAADHTASPAEAAGYPASRRQENINNTSANRPYNSGSGCGYNGNPQNRNTSGSGCGYNGNPQNRNAPGKTSGSGYGNNGNPQNRNISGSGCGYNGNPQNRNISGSGCGYNGNPQNQNNSGRPDPNGYTYPDSGYPQISNDSGKRVKQVLKEVREITLEVSATGIGMVGKVFSSFGDMSEQMAESIRQQNSGTDNSDPDRRSPR